MTPYTRFEFLQFGPGGLTRELLTDWLEAGHVSVADPEHLTFPECCAISAFAWLTWRGMPDNYASRVAKQVNERAAQLLAAHGPDLMDLESKACFEVLALSVDAYDGGGERAHILAQILPPEQLVAALFSGRLPGPLHQVYQIDYEIWRLWKEAAEKFPRGALWAA